jgi:hypothetical protein
MAGIAGETTTSLQQCEMKSQPCSISDKYRGSGKLAGKARARARGREAARGRRRARAAWRLR